MGYITRESLGADPDVALAVKGGALLRLPGFIADTANLGVAELILANPDPSPATESDILFWDMLRPKSAPLDDDSTEKAA